MSKAIVIEIAGETAGLVVGGSGNFRFFSAQPAFDALDGKIFRSVEQANRAVIAHGATRTLPRAA